jgi:hypothetical protein
MKTIVVAPREGRQIEFELGECMACLENAEIRDYSARLERYGAFCEADRPFPIAVKALADAGFEIPSSAEVNKVRMSFTNQRSQGIVTGTKRPEHFTEGGKP